MCDKECWEEISAATGYLPGIICENAQQYKGFPHVMCHQCIKIIQINLLELCSSYFMHKSFNFFLYVICQTTNPAMQSDAIGTVCR